MPCETKSSNRRRVCAAPHRWHVVVFKLHRVQLVGANGKAVAGARRRLVRRQALPALPQQRRHASGNGLVLATKRGRQLDIVALERWTIEHVPVGTAEGSSAH